MSFPRRKLKVVALLAIVILMALVFGWRWHGSPPKNQAQSQPQTSKTTGNPGQQPTAAKPGTADFSYQKPAFWAEMSQKLLGASGAASGIAHPNAPVATFTIKVSPSTPSNESELKNSSLNDIKKNAHNFALVSSVETTVDGQRGQKFTYSFTDLTGQNKLIQQMSVIPYKGKTFFLLFSSAAPDFDKQKAGFTDILSSFQFK